MTGFSFLGEPGSDWDLNSAVEFSTIYSYNKGSNGVYFCGMFSDLVFSENNVFEKEIHSVEIAKVYSTLLKSNWALDRFVHFFLKHHGLKNLIGAGFYKNIFGIN